MDLDTLRSICLRLPETSEDFPFDETTLAVRVAGKIFALVAIDASPLQANLKCDPERAVELRERYEAVQPGYHMNKKHWNTVVFDGSIPPREITSMIEHSWECVVAGMKRSDRERLVQEKSLGR